MISKERLMTVKEVARVLGIAERTLYQWSWKNQNLPFVKVGKSLRVSKRDLFDFIEKRKRSPENN